MKELRPFGRENQKCMKREMDENQHHKAIAKRFLESVFSFILTVGLKARNCALHTHIADIFSLKSSIG